MKIEFISERTGIYGGLKRMYRLAQYFIEQGHEAAVNIGDSSKVTWFKHSVPENVSIKADVRIMPEPWQQPLTGAKNLLFYQAQFDPPESQFDGIITTSDYLADIIRKEGFEPTYVIPYGFDSNIFTENPARRITGRVGYMPRKNAAEASLVRALCPGVEFVAIDGVDETTVVEKLQECDIFLLMSRVEGFGMTGFEAALCGCLLIGYHGWGGQKWLTNRTCVLTGSPQEMALEIRNALLGVYESRRIAAKEMVITELTPEKEKRAWTEVLRNLK